MWSFLYLLAFLLPLTISLTIIDRVKEPTGWIEVGRTDSNKEIKLVFAVKHQNVDELYKSLIEKSTPYTKEYGNWMTNDEVHELIAPSEESLTMIKTWLISKGIKENDIKSITRNSDFLYIITTIQQAEIILNCKYYDYIHSKKNHWRVSRVRMNTDYYVDDIVAKHLDFVSPTHPFPPISGLRITKRITNNNNVNAGEVTPTFLRELYNVGSAEGKSSSNTEGVASFQDQYYEMSDLEAFWKNMILHLIMLPMYQVILHRVMV